MDGDYKYFSMINDQKRERRKLLESVIKWEEREFESPEGKVKLTRS